MRWLIVLIIVVAAAWLMLRLRGRRAVLDHKRINELDASAAARRRLDEHRNPRDGSPGSGSGGVGGWG
jgi:hypothetical protein